MDVLSVWACPLEPTVTVVCWPINDTIALPRSAFDATCDVSRLDCCAELCVEDGDGLDSALVCSVDSALVAAWVDETTAESRETVALELAVIGSISNEEDVVVGFDAVLEIIGAGVAEAAFPVVEALSVTLTVVYNIVST